MRFGLDLSQSHLDFPEVVRRVRLAESLGFDGIWLGDHFKPNFPGSRFEVGNYLEAWSTLAALATITSKVRLGVLVSGVTHRHPSVLAAQAATIDHISQGRLDFGLGAAWAQSEHFELGIPFPTAAERARRLEEAVTVVQLLLTGDGVDFEGRYYQLRNATYKPRPVQKPHPPIWIGGSGERYTIPLTARQANAWHAFGTVATLDRKSALLNRLSAEAGRDPSAILRATDLAIEEPCDAVRRKIGALVSIGFEYLIVTWPLGGSAVVEGFARDCMWGQVK